MGAICVLFICPEQDVKRCSTRVEAEPRIKKCRRNSEMKREDLRKIEGITDAIVDAVMDLHQTDAEAWKAEKKSLEATVKSKEDNIAELNDKVKSFDGVDVEGLKKQAKVLEDKYKYELAKAKKDGLIDLALSKAGAKNEKMLRALIDMEKVSVKDGALEGLKDQIETIKKDNGFLFEPEKKEVNLGGEHQGGTPGSKPEGVLSIYDAVNEYYK